MTSKFDEARFTVETLSSSILANKPPFSLTIGDPTVMFVRTAEPGSPPSHTPVTSCIASTFAVVTPTLSILLKLSTAWPATGYLIISPTFKLEIIFAFGLVITPLVAISTWSAIPNPFNCVFCKTTSPAKFELYPDSPLVAWWTDFTSRSSCISTVLIDLTNDSSPFIIICSPAINLPDVCVSFTFMLLLTVDSTNPVAPLLTPLINEVAGHSKASNATLTTKSVKVWTSNTYRSCSVAALEYGASDKLWV